MYRLSSVCIFAISNQSGCRTPEQSLVSLPLQLDLVDSSRILSRVETEMASEPRTVWILVYPAPDVAGQWVGHCLDLDVVSQGDSMEHAFMMAREATDLVVRSDVDAGLDPFDREQAPEEDWEPLFTIMKHAVPLRHIPRERWSEIRLAAFSYDVLMPVNNEVEDDGAQSAPFELPPAYMVARHQEQRESGSFPPHR